MKITAARLLFGLGSALALAGCHTHHHGPAEVVEPEISLHGYYYNGYYYDRRYYENGRYRYEGRRAQPSTQPSNPPAGTSGGTSVSPTVAPVIRADGTTVLPTDALTK